MRTVFRIFARDLKRIVRNPAAVVIALGVCIIPSLYAWINILANWDPYENTSTVPVAVVIEDAGADIPDRGPTNAGEMVRERLEENDQLGWTFVDTEKEATDKVRAGDAYAAFIIPRDFTSTLAGVLDGSAQPAHIAYYVNEKENAIAPKVTDTGATTLEDQISNEFVRVVGEVASEKLKGAAAGALADIDRGTTGAASALRDTASSLDGLSRDIDGLDATLSSSRDAIADARASLASIAGTSDALAGTLDSSLGTLGDARSGMREMASTLSDALGTGTGTIARISSTSAYDLSALAGDVAWAQSTVDAAIARIRALDGTVQTFKTSLETVRSTIVTLTPQDGEQTTIQTDIVKELDVQIQALVELSDAQNAQLDRLQQISDDIKRAAGDVRDLSGSVAGAVQDGTERIADLQAQLSGGALPELTSSLDAFASAGGRLSGALASVRPLTEQASSLLGQLDTLLDQTASTARDTSSTIRDTSARVRGLADDLDALGSAQAASELSRLVDLDPARIGSFMGSPAAMVDKAVFPVENYGSGVAPFYTNLALWVGGFVLVAIYKLEVDAEGIGTVLPYQAFFGRWLLLAALGQIQAIICCTGDVLLGIQCVSPVAYVFAGMVASLVYVLIVYALAVSFKHIGKALGVLLVVLQIPGAAGTYPIEMMPGFFRALHPWLPFTYGIDAMREAVAGFYGMYYVQNLAVLMLFCAPALIVGIGARRRLLRINTLFDRRLAQTDLMIAERTDATEAVRAPENLGGAGALLADSARARGFERAYPRLVHRGLIALGWVPAVLLLALFVLPAKLPLLICWIVSLACSCAYLIVIEYLHSLAAPVAAVHAAAHGRAGTGSHFPSDSERS
ncbi:YhgE/Pip domain-containing protein [Collinsella ihumii]|uniref:YhgE/Pip domain-containing protein n=1 Tax=Collinsella ihumii TaxID=1720204 RepID=UPI00082D0D1E|nr:YhgE/Pip domain-containing protein [Collinsella ihumii]